MRTYHQNGTLPQNGEIFVFGSNLAGIHGAGAAKVAVKFGAKYGVGIGVRGNTYAIPTKDQYIQTLPLEEIEFRIKEFCDYTRNYGNGKKFFVTAVGCGLAGYKDRHIAPLFKSAVNCSFPLEWQPILED